MSLTPSEKRIRARARDTARLTQAQRETEIRNIAKKVSHRPIQEIQQIIRERTGIAADPNFIRELLTKF